MTSSKNNLPDGSNNLILRSLSPVELERVSEFVEPVELDRGTIIFSPFKPLDYLYFIHSGMVSFSLTLSDGTMVEIGVMGSEGVIGWQALAGMDTGPFEASVQIEMTAHRLKATHVQSLIGEIRPLRLGILRAAQGMFDQTAQSAACSQRHNSSERLAKWLLMANDRSVSDTVLISHETLSILLGIRRASVTVAMGELRQLGCVENSNSKIKIINRNRLEAAACECYHSIRQEAERRAKLPLI